MSSLEPTLLPNMVDQIRSYNEQMNRYAEEMGWIPAEGTVRGDKIYRHGRFVPITDLSAAEREEK